MAEYQPGTCNIDQKESRKRLVAGIAGFFNAFILTAVLFFFPSLQILYVPIFLLNFVGFLGFIQYRRNFCAGLGLKGKMHIGDLEEEVSDPEKVSQDRRNAVKILAISLISSGVLTFAGYLVLASI